MQYMNSTTNSRLQLNGAAALLFADGLFVSSYLESCLDILQLLPRRELELPHLRFLFPFCAFDSVGASSSFSGMAPTARARIVFVLR